MSALSAESLAALFGAAPNGVYLVQEGTFRFANIQFQQDTGYALDELLTMDGLAFVYADDQEAVRFNAIAMLKGQRRQPYEFRTIAKSGEVRWAVGSILSVSYEGQRAALGYYFDVTEQRRTQKWMRRQEAERARLDALQEASMAMVHHVLNALAPIIGHAELFDGRDLERRRGPCSR